MEPDTSMGGSCIRFPETQHSAIIALQTADQGRRAVAHEAVIAAYWKPAYKHVRTKWKASNEEAKDFIQGFFARAFEKDFFISYDPGKGSFRNFLRTCLDRFVANERKSEERLKRGGAAIKADMDFAAAESELQQWPHPAGDSIEDQFQREWVRSLFALAVEELRRRCTEKGWNVHFGLFRRYDLSEGDDRPTYAELAGECGVGLTDVTNYLAAVRREFRGIVLGKLRELTASEQEFRTEMRAVLGLDG